MFKKIGNGIVTRLSPTRTHWSGLKAEITARLRHFRQGRYAVTQTALERDFSLLLKAWGIASEADIPGILRDFRLRCLVLAVPMLMALIVALVMPGLYALLTIILVAAPCLFGLLVTRWRMSILQNRAFSPLLHWMRGWLIARFTKERSE